MLGPAFQTSWFMEKQHDKSRTLPDPDIFTFDKDKLPGMLEKMENAKNHNPVGAKGLFGSLHFDKGNKIERDISGNTNEGDRSSSSQENNYSGVDSTGRSKGPTISKVIREIQHVDVTGTGLGMNKAAAPVVAASSRTTPSSNTSNAKPATSSSGTMTNPVNSLMKNLIPRIPSKLRVSPRASKEIRKGDQEDFEIGLEPGVSGDAAVVDDDKHQLEEMNEKDDNGGGMKLTSQSRSSTSKEYSNNGEESGTGTKSEESIAKIRRADSVDFVNFYLNETTQIGINSGRQYGGRGQHHHEDHRAVRKHHDDHMKIDTNAAVSRRSSGVFSTGELSVRTGEGDDEDDISSPGTPRVVAEDRKKVEDDRARKKEEELLGKMEQMLESKLELVMQKQMEALLLAQGKMTQTAQPQPHLQEPGFAAQQMPVFQQPPERNDKPASSLGGSSERSLMVSVPIRGSRDTEDS